MWFCEIRTYLPSSKKALSTLNRCLYLKSFDGTSKSNLTIKMRNSPCKLFVFFFYIHRQSSDGKLKTLRLMWTWPSPYNSSSVRFFTIRSLAPSKWWFFNINFISLFLRSKTLHRNKPQKNNHTREHRGKMTKNELV